MAGIMAGYETSGLGKQVEEYAEKHMFFGNWMLLEKDGKPKELGRGSYGIVYAIVPATPAHPEGDTDLIHAMKVMDRAKKSRMDNAIQEINIQKTLAGTCPYIVRIDNYDYINFSADEDGPGSQGRYIIQMELLQPLIRVTGDVDEGTGRVQFCNDKLADGDIGEIFKLALQVGTALKDAHEYKVSQNSTKGFLHRDVKLDNIMYDPKSGTYKLGDFGVAGVMVEGGLNKTQAGTRMYMAPEVGIKRGYDQGADIYSFGIVLYLLLNNMRWPGCDDDFLIQDGEHLVDRYNLDKIPEPANGTKKLKTIVARACDNEPKKRYSSMNELMEDLRAAAREYFQSLFGDRQPASQDGNTDETGKKTAAGSGDVINDRWEKENNSDNDETDWARTFTGRKKHLIGGFEADPEAEELWNQLISGEEDRDGEDIIPGPDEGGGSDEDIPREIAELLGGRKNKEPETPQDGTGDVLPFPFDETGKLTEDGEINFSPPDPVRTVSGFIFLFAGLVFLGLTIGNSRISVGFTAGLTAALLFILSIVRIYYSYKNPFETDVEDLRDFLLGLLVISMIPAAVFVVAAFYFKLSIILTIALVACIWFMPAWPGVVVALVFMAGWLVSAMAGYPVFSIMFEFYWGCPAMILLCVATMLLSREYGWTTTITFASVLILAGIVTGVLGRFFGVNIPLWFTRLHPILAGILIFFLSMRAAPPGTVNNREDQT